MASDTGGVPGQDSPLGPRTPGRHAAPRTTVRNRLRLPVGRALALTAVPTALLMGTIAPKLAFAADARSTSASSADLSTASGPEGAACTKTSLKALEQGTAPTSTPTTAPKTAPKTTPVTAKSVKSSAGTSGGGGTAPSTPTPTASAPAGSPKNPQPGSLPTTAATPTTKPTTKPTAKPANPIVGVLNGLGGLLGLDASQVSPASTSATPTPAATPAARTASTRSSTPTATATPAANSTPAASSTPSAPAPQQSTPAATHTSAPPVGTTRHPVAQPTANGTPATAAEANKLCDVRDLAAPMDTSVINGITEMPSVPWTLKSSDLELINTQFWGVVTVPTAAGDVRVLKFTAQEVNIGDLDMSTQQVGQELHVQGGPGTTSTMTGGTVTMYVTSLSGTLASAEGIPLSWLGVNLTLTPDTLPQWLYDLIGDVPIPLTLSLTNAVATQTGQFGGDLTIPGMHLFYTPNS